MSKTLNIAICEDSPVELKHLHDVLLASKISVTIDHYTCGEDFLAEYYLRKYDLVFMDIYMTGMTGIETVTEIRKIDPAVAIAFTTTSLDHALDSYRLEALKYIEKPVTVKAVFPILALTLMQKEYIPTFDVRTKDGEVKVPLSNILYFEQTGMKYNIHLIEGKVIIANGKISTIIEQLESDSFYQCHKSYIVNFAYVKSLNKEFLVFEMAKGDNVHISRGNFWKSKKAYEEFLFENPQGGDLFE